MPTFKSVHLTMHQTSAEKTIQQVANWITAVGVFVLPFFFLPITSDFFTFQKQAYTLVLTAILAVLWLVRISITKKITFRSTPLTIPLVVFALIAILSLFFASTNKVQALINPLGVGTITMLVVLSLLMTDLLDERGIMLVKQALLLSATVLAVFTLYQYLGLGELIAPAAFMKAKNFTPTGSLLTTAIYLVLFIPFIATRLYQTSQKRQRVELILSLLIGVIIVIGASVAAYQLITTDKPVVLPQRAGWTIASEVFKNKPFLGIGTENFLSAYTQGKPVWLNTTNIWNVRFGLSSNTYFHLFTTLGSVGVLCFLLIVGMTVSTWKKAEDKVDEVLITLIALFIIAAFTAPSFLLFAVLVILTGLLQTSITQRSLKLPDNQLLTSILFLIPIILIIVTLYGVGKVYSAELTFKQSLDALSRNDGSATYNLQIKAIGQDPYLPGYHITYAQTNLLLANSLAQNKDLSDQDRQTITQLVQQSIQSGRNAVLLNQLNPLAWENLATTYQQLIAFTQGEATQWAIASFQQAIALDPMNPQLRIDLGSIFFSSKDYDSATRQFEIATQLKPDHANAHYNLAVALRENKKYDRALAEMQAVLKLVEPGSNDYKLVEDEVNKLKDLVGTTQEQQGQPETLKGPQTPEAKLDQPIELPQNAAPPAEPSPSVTPSPQPSSSSTVEGAATSPEP